jgi:transaldolase
VVSGNTVASEIDAASAHIAALDAQGIDLNVLGERLQQEGLAQFATAFGKLLELTA